MSDTFDHESDAYDEMMRCADSIEKINRAFHEAAGRKPEFVETGLTTADYVYPNYCDDPRLVIEVMREREDFDEFIDIGIQSQKWFEADDWIDLFMDRTGKLAVLATEWINKQKGKSDG